MLLGNYPGPVHIYGYNFEVTNKVFCCMSECERDYLLKMMNQTIGNIRTFPDFRDPLKRSQIVTWRKNVAEMIYGGLIWYKISTTKL